MKFRPTRTRTQAEIEKSLPAAVAAIDGATDKEIEQIVKRNRQAQDMHWDLVASQFGFRG